MKMSHMSLWKRLSLVSTFALSGGILALTVAVPAAQASSFHGCDYNCNNNTCDDYYYNNYCYANSGNLPIYPGAPVSEPTSPMPLAPLTPPVTYNGYCNSPYYHSYCGYNWQYGQDNKDNQDNDNQDNNNNHDNNNNNNHDNNNNNNNHDNNNNNNNHHNNNNNHHNNNNNNHHNNNNNNNHHNNNNNNN